MADHHEIAWALLQILNGLNVHDVRGFGLPEEDVQRVLRAKARAHAALDTTNRLMESPGSVEKGRCRDCRHWCWPNAFNLEEYDRGRDPRDGWADGVCTELRSRLTITCSGGWDGCTVDYVETDANFSCAFWEPKPSEQPSL